jgi:hypothetical protein
VHISGSSFLPDECFVSYYNSYETTCSCASNSSNNNGFGKNNFFATTFDILTSDFTHRLEQTTSLSASTILHNLVITIMTATLLGVSSIAWYYFIRVDLKERANKRGLLDLRRKLSNDVKAYFDQLLPVEFSSDRWYLRFYRKLRFEHDWMCMLLSYEPLRDFRSIRLIKAASRIMNFLFLVHCSLQMMDVVKVINHQLHV